MGGVRETPPLQATIIDREREPPLLLHRRRGLELLLLLWGARLSGIFLVLRGLLPL